MVTSDVDIIIIMILELEYCQVLAIQTGGVTIAALMCCNNEVLTKPEMEIDKSFFSSLPTRRVLTVGILFSRLLVKSTVVYCTITAP